MAGLAEKMIVDFFEAKEIHPEVLDGYFRVGWSIEGTSIDVFFVVDEDDTHVHLRGLNFVKIPESKFEKMYQVVNTLNDEYNYVKFIVDTEHETIAARDDAVIQLDSCGEESFELMMRMVGIVQDAYPEIMKALWA
ncbi:MAG: YbjN domain-containing protein [Lachnospiraceae bacterium]|nr:YbjN domain-containing protein [Lachnospiraceae bacterium]